VLLDAFERAENGDGAFAATRGAALFTDEATVVEAAGHTVHLVEGEVSNIKITLPADLLYAERLIQRIG